MGFSCKACVAWGWRTGQAFWRAVRKPCGGQGKQQTVLQGRQDWVRGALPAEQATGELRAAQALQAVGASGP